MALNTSWADVPMKAADDPLSPGCNVQAAASVRQTWTFRDNGCCGDPWTIIPKTSAKRMKLKRDTRVSIMSRAAEPLEAADYPCR